MNPAENSIICNSCKTQLLKYGTAKIELECSHYICSKCINLTNEEGDKHTIECECGNK